MRGVNGTDLYTRTLRMHPEDLGPPFAPMSLEAGFLGPLERE